MTKRFFAVFSLMMVSVTMLMLLLSNGIQAASDGPGLFVDSGQLLGSASSYAVALGDVDGDGDLDAFIGKHGANEVWLNDGTGIFTNSGQILATNSSYGVALGDLDGDGDLDVFIANRAWSAAPDKVWLNDGHGYFNVTAQSLGNTSSYDVALGDVNMDGTLDAFVAACGDPLANLDNTNILWLNDGAAHFSDSGLDFGTLCSVAVSIGDLNHDGKIDIVVANAGISHGVEVWINMTVSPSATVAFSKTQIIDLTYNFDVGLGDFNGDTHLDVFIANADALSGVQPDHIWVNDGMGNFVDSGHLLGSTPSGSVALGDFNEDGYLDAAVATGSHQHELPDTVWFNDADFNFSTQVLGVTYGLDIAAGDLDGDSDLDLFIATVLADQVWFNRLIMDDHFIFLPYVQR
ncbi:MAG TPA: VCBS repeat-containing protein [Chloroflexota bacterium]|nr:VCBS repeat-containing protein [Chloroflexota bacterium]